MAEINNSSQNPLGTWFERLPLLPSGPDGVGHHPIAKGLTINAVYFSLVDALR